MAQLINSFKECRFPRRALKAARRIKHPMRASVLAPRENIKRTKFPIFHTKFYPRSFPVKQVLRRHWLAIDSDPTLYRIFPNCPTVALKGQNNLKSALTSSSINYTTPTLQLSALESTLFTYQRFPSLSRQNHKCLNQSCQACLLLTLGSHIRSFHNHKLFPIDSLLTCTTEHIIYMYVLTCRLCGKQYIDSTTKCLRREIPKLKLATKTAVHPFIRHLNQVHHVFFLQLSTCILCKGSTAELKELWISKLPTAVPYGLNPVLWSINFLSGSPHSKSRHKEQWYNWTYILSLPCLYDCGHVLSTTFIIFNNDSLHILYSIIILIHV